MWLWPYLNSREVPWEWNWDNTSKKCPHQNKAFKQYWWKRIACELHQTNTELVLQRAAAAHRATDELKKTEAYL
jgi:hypothetical protein